MRLTRMAVWISSLFLAVSPLALARGGAGGGDAHMSGPPSSSKALVNSNGRFASDRDKGLDRAEDRRSAKGNAHEKATRKTKKATRTANRQSRVFPPAPPTPPGAPAPRLPARPDLP